MYDGSRMGTLGYSDILVQQSQEELDSVLSIARKLDVESCGLEIKS